MKTGNCSDLSGNDNTSLEPAASAENKLKNPFPESNMPEKETKTWCSYMEREFRASRSTIDTNTDTSAFSSEGETSADVLRQDEFRE